MQTIEFQLEPADVEAWYLYQLDSAKAYRYQYWATAVAASGLCAVYVGQWAGSTVISAAAAVLGFGAGWYGAHAVLRSSLRAVARERAKGPTSATQFGTHQLSLDASGISEIGPATQHKHDWKAVEGLVESSGHLFVRVPGGAAYVIPKRAFVTEAEKVAFRSAFIEATTNRAPPER